MDEEYSADIITLEDEEGNNHEFEILDAIETDNGRYVALIPLEPSPEALEDDGTYYIFEVIAEGDEEQLLEVEDENLLDDLAKVFESRYEESLGEEDEE
ncbi:MAG: DUF1292 domain-containing protein [Oscillospiraceae bacterium]|jgi:uncharacterized protein YrzB (UPF0473 family)|nr:DUF1292 domain-containing protein [Oscillospiraceae bacterium]